MTAEQKALELVERFCNISKEITFTEAKQSALICVNEIIKSEPISPLSERTPETFSDMLSEAKEYWQSVRNEIINYK